MILYEVLIALSEKSSEEEQKKTIKELESLIEKAKGSVSNTESWGKRALAFPINKNTNAFFWLLNVEGNESLPKAVTDSLRIEDSVLRFLIEKKVTVKKAKKTAKKKVVTTEIIR
jgi:small subunit ribosomal protein S6